ncbi:MAG: CDP-diacylglycerol--glycerol-3-phosphate 3-phosphatidyltransferase [Ectothiorhodospiraceae bacterium]|nr:CDP-diacylglycerol--glycerol-3-phosphate 3-phosphatidyltransferase [Ectothiorhodospiraceae bacterium]
MPLNIPNLLTWLRIALIPLIVVTFYYLPIAWAGPVSAIIFAVAGLTDWLDGYLARRLGQTSRFGAFLDPVADKLMVAAALVMLVDVHGGLWLTVAAIVIIGREIAISALREWMAEIGQRAKVAVSFLGKLKTTAQMVAIFMLLYHYPLLGVPMREVGLWLLYAAAVLTLWSMASYLRAALRQAGPDR